MILINGEEFSQLCQAITSLVLTTFMSEKLEKRLKRWETSIQNFLYVIVILRVTKKAKFNRRILFHFRKYQNSRVRSSSHYCGIGCEGKRDGFIHYYLQHICWASYVQNFQKRGAVTGGDCKTERTRRAGLLFRAETFNVCIFYIYIYVLSDPSYVRYF